MNSGKIGIKSVIIFGTAFIGAGGSERLTFEEAKWLEKAGLKTHILTFDLKENEPFNLAYGVNIQQVGSRIKSKNLLIRIIQAMRNILTLREKIKEIKPDLIITSSPLNGAILYLATIFTSFSYFLHIHETAFWGDDPKDFTKYAIIHKKVFREIRESLLWHKVLIPEKPPRSGIFQRLWAEVFAIAQYIGVKKAKKIFLFSNQMKWEVKKLYGKDSIVIKGAYPPEIFSYIQKQNIKEKLNLNDKRMILMVNRLVPRKRVDLLIKAFKQISENFNDVILVIGGKGPEEKNLKELTKNLNISDKVKFVGYIEEQDIWDYFLSCEVYAHPDHADFDISAYQPLALQRKIVWTSEMEIGEMLADNKHIFIAEPTVNDFAEALKKALKTDLYEDIREKERLSSYTWDRYVGHILKEI